MGHARALLGLESAAAMERLARRTVAQDLSVRKVEELVRRERDGRQRGGGQPTAARGRSPSANARDLALRLTRALGTRVDVDRGRRPAAATSRSTTTRSTSWTRCSSACVRRDR